MGNAYGRELVATISNLHYQLVHNIRVSPYLFKTTSAMISEWPDKLSGYAAVPLLGVLAATRSVFFLPAQSFCIPTGSP